MSKSVLFKFENGDKVQDSISKFKGIITCRCENITGCIQYTISPECDKKDGKFPESIWIDESRLVKVPNKRAKKIAKPRSPEGPNRNPPRTPRAINR